MGLFDSIIKKAVRSATNAITDTIIDNTVKPTVEKAVKEKFDIKETNYSISEQYNEFPVYPDKIITEPIETRTEKYTRLTFTCSGFPKAEYENILMSKGYVKATNVRFDNGNKYIIVEDLGGKTKIVFHIKK